jgi:PAS domain S-box-containing protein
MSKARVLIVEDEQVIAEHLQHMLIHLGYEVPVTASSAEHAVTLVEVSRPDLVLMDIMLEGPMDGIEAAQLIRDGFRVPVVYLSAYSDAALLDRAKLSEPFGYLVKPVRKEALRTAIEVALYKARVDRKVRESEERFRALAELLPQIVYEIDRSGRFTFVNQSGLEFFGYTTDDLSIGLRLFDMISDADRRNLQEHMRSADKGEPFGEIECSICGKDGQVLSVVTHATPIVEEGEVKGVRGVAVDISERKMREQLLRQNRDELDRLVQQRTAELSEANSRLKKEVEDRKAAEQAARESERLFRTIFETAQDCLYIKDLQLRYTLVNPFMKSLLGLSQEEIVTKTDEQLFAAETCEHLRQVDSRVLAGELIEEEHAREIAGQNLTFHDVKIPLRDDAGQIVGLFGVSRNITERKRAVRPPGTTDEQALSQVMKETLRHAHRAAQTNSVVLLLGESGSGKDYVARWIHDRSKRSAGPFFAMNCATLTPELAESELFGHETGAFTGAKGRLRGLLELAEGGTLLLNEIGELPLPLQAKLLTFLDTRSFTRVGGRELIKVDARIIAATNRNLRDEVDKGSFREDLFFRLNVLSLTIPPLRERKADLPLLARKTVRELATDLQMTNVPDIGPKALERLSAYDWPGNVRELRNVIEREMILNEGGALEFAALGSGAAEDTGWHWSVGFPPPTPIDKTVQSLQIALIEEALRRSAGLKQEAAELLGISRFALRRLRARLDLEEGP